jgi:competence protein ComEA
MDPLPLHVERPRRVSGEPWLISLLILWVLLLVHAWRAEPQTSVCANVTDSTVDRATQTLARAEATRPVMSTIDPNTAPWWELTVLPGIGERRARAVVAFRESAAKAGTAIAFHSANDLAQVRGIGPRTVERIRPHLHFPQDAGEDG